MTVGPIQAVVVGFPDVGPAAARLAATTATWQTLPGIGRQRV